MPAVIVYKFSKCNHVLAAAHKGSGDKVDVVFNAEEQVAFCLLYTAIQCKMQTTCAWVV